MILIDTKPDEILRSRDPEKVGRFMLNVPTRQHIRTLDLKIDNVVEVPGGRRFKILKVELTFQLLSPPIPALILETEEVT